MKFILKNTVIGAGILLSMSTAAQSETEPVAHVQIATAHMEQTSRQLAAYGRIMPATDGIVRLTTPFGCNIAQVLIANDQPVKQGDVLFRLSPDSDALALLGTLTAAKQDLEETTARFELKLADRQELLHAQQAAANAQQQMARLTALGLDADGQLSAPCNGFIEQINVKAGDQIGTGTALATIDRPNRRELIVGIEANQAGLLKVGQSVQTIPVLHTAETSFTGHILRIGRAIDPESGMIQIAASIDNSDSLATREYMKARFSVDQRKALVIPASAVLPDENEQVVYTVRDGQAVRHTVKTELLSGGRARIIDGDLNEGDQVVTLGNYELEDGMKVAVEVSP